MADQNAPTPENFGSAANMMSDALDKASAELDKTVRACIDHLISSNDALEKSLSQQLMKVVEQSKNFIDVNIEDLTSHKEELLDRLNEFERTEIETMMSAAREVRQQVAGRGHQASDSITKLVEEQLAELRTLIENPEARFANFAGRGLESLNKFSGESCQQIETAEASLEQVLTGKAQELDLAVQQVIAETKKGIEETLDKYNSEMEEKITSVVSHLTEIVGETVSELEIAANKGAKSVEKAGAAGKAKLVSRLEEWKKDSNEIGDNFRNTITFEATSSQQSHSTKLERKVGEVKDEISHIATDANAKITASHKLFLSSLKRLEKKYNDRLERLMARFDTAMAEESRITGGTDGLVSHELRELLHARLQARGAELLKTFQRTVDQLESEYARTSGGSSERIETVKSAATESLDKQLRMQKNELERISRSFTNELGELNLQVPQIEEAGRAAALAVMAYRSAMLQFERD
jgi:hypothetical protein